MPRLAKHFVMDAPEELGDYQRVVITGMTGCKQRLKGRLQLQRVGPFAPPLSITLPGDLLVTEAVRARLKGVAGVKGFRKVVKDQVVRVDDFERFLRKANELPGDPEQFILDGPHDETAAEEMGEIYEVELETDSLIESQYGRKGPAYRFSELPTKRFQLFRADHPGNFGCIIVTADFAETLLPDAMRWIELRLISTK